MIRRMPPGSSRTRPAVAIDSNQPGGLCWNTAMPPSLRCRRTAARNSRRVPGSALTIVLASRTTSKARSSRSDSIGEQTVVRSGLRSSMPGESSTPVTGCPSAARGRRIRPVPQPSSSTDAPGGAAACTISASPNAGSSA
jgi:hypothetical protein